nr:uncharacterized protein LOC111416384 [Onthophagus taurus]
MSSIHKLCYCYNLICTIFISTKNIMCSVISILSNLLLEKWKTFRIYVEARLLNQRPETITNVVRNRFPNKEAIVKICVKPLLRSRGDGNFKKKKPTTTFNHKEELLDVLSDLTLNGTATTSVACLEELYSSDEYGGALCDSLFVIEYPNSPSCNHNKKEDTFLTEQLDEYVKFPEESKEDLMVTHPSLSSAKSVSVRDRNNPKVVKAPYDRAR